MRMGGTLEWLERLARDSANEFNCPPISTDTVMRLSKNWTALVPPKSRTCLPTTPQLWQYLPVGGLPMLSSLCHLQ